MSNSVKLKMKRFKQDPAACATASSSSVGNYYNKAITYESVKKAFPPTGNGLYTPEIGILLNNMGFGKVTVITADINQFDFHWAGLGRKAMLDKIKDAKKRQTDHNLKQSLKNYTQFLSQEGNEVIIDCHFGKYIRKTLDEGIPVLASFNWNLFFNQPKVNNSGKIDAIKGDYEDHEVVINGYDEKGVSIIDSHHTMYTGKLARFQSGRYNIPWELLHTVIGFGDLILVGDYNPENCKI